MSATIGRWQGASLLATTLLGTGVFILPQLTAAAAGEQALIAWLLLTLAIIPVAIVFAALAGRYPHAGGPAYFVEQAFGATAGRTIGLIFLLVVPLGMPAALLMGYEFIHALHAFEGNSPLYIQLAAIVLLFALNWPGLQLSAKFQMALTLAMVAVVLFMLVMSGAMESQTQMTPSGFANFGGGGVMAALAIAFWSFLGLEAMTHLAAEFKSPREDMKLAMIGGTVLVGGLYLACTWLVLAYPNDESLAMVGILQSLLGGFGQWIICILGLASSLATVNVYCAGTSRLIASFSEQGVLPAVLKRRNRHQVPALAMAILLSLSALVTAVVHWWHIDLESLVVWVNGVFVIIYMSAMIAAVRLLPRGYLTPVVLALGFCLLMAWSLAGDMMYGVVITIGVALALHLRGRSKTNIASI